MTEATKAKISAAKMGNTCALGHAYSPSMETRAKMSIAHINPSSETRARISAAHKGHIISLETRAKISKAHWLGGSLVSIPKKNAKRRTLGYVYLNERFIGCEGHHIDNERVINMPQKLHRSVYHRQSDGRGMAQINAIAYNFLFKQEVEAALEDKREQLA